MPNHLHAILLVKEKMEKLKYLKNANRNAILQVII